MTGTSAARPRTPRPGGPTARSRPHPAAGPDLDGPFEASGLGDIADPLLAESGSTRIEWAERAMPVLQLLRERFTADQPFAGLAVAACLNVTAETAILVRALRSGGASVSLAASNPLSTQDDVAAALALRHGIAVFARAGVDRPTYYRHIEQALTGAPDLVVDDGCDLVNTLHTQHPDLLPGVRGGCESTTTGVIRLRRMAAEGALKFPVVAANDTATRRLVDSTFGTGQSVLDGIVRASQRELEAVEGVGTVRAREIREGLRRLQEHNLVDRYLQL